MKIKQVAGVSILSIVFLLLFISMVIDSSFTTALAVWGSAILISTAVLIGVLWTLGGNLKDLFN